MKKMVLCSAVALLSITACRNDDDNTTQETSIVGTWQPVKHFTYDGKTNAIIEEEVINDCEQKERLTLTNDGKATHTYFEINPQLGNSCIELGVDNGTYKYDATKKEISSHIDGVHETVAVLKLSNTELEIVGETYDVNNDGLLDKETTLYKRVAQ